MDQIFFPIRNAYEDDDHAIYIVLLFHIYTEKQADYYLITNLMVQTCFQTKYT